MYETFHQLQFIIYYKGSHAMPYWPLRSYSYEWSGDEEEIIKAKAPKGSNHMQDFSTLEELALLKNDLSKKSKDVAFFDWKIHLLVFSLNFDTVSARKQWGTGTTIIPSFYVQAARQAAKEQRKKDLEERKAEQKRKAEEISDNGQCWYG